MTFMILESLFAEFMTNYEHALEATIEYFITLVSNYQSPWLFIFITAIPIIRGFRFRLAFARNRISYLWKLSWSKIPLKKELPQSRVHVNKDNLNSLIYWIKKLKPVHSWARLHLYWWWNCWFYLVL